MNDQNKKANTYNVCVKLEEGYTLDDYAKIIELEKGRMQRLVDTHDYIRDAQKKLVPVSQVPHYSLSKDCVDKTKEVNFYQRYTVGKVFYGVPSRPKMPPETISALEKNKDLISKVTPFELMNRSMTAHPSDQFLREKLCGEAKVVCTSEKFWAEYHFLLHELADQDENFFYGWNEQALDVNIETSTPCHRYAPFTYQSWVHYRAACDGDDPVIIMDACHWQWALDNTATIIPQHATFLLLVDQDGECPVYATDTGQSTRCGRSIFTVDFKNAIPASIKSKSFAGVEKPWPKISIVVCSYNQAEYLEKCLTSILDQQYPNLELIVVDGLSTDGSVAILEKYKPNIDQLIIEKDDGQSDALNKGFALSTGDIMTWICSDDGLEQNALFIAAYQFLSADVDIVVGGCKRVDVRGKTLVVHHTHLPFDQVVPLSFGDMISFGYTWLKSSYFIQPELFWSRRIWELSGGYIKNHMFYAMDYELFLRFALAGATAIHIHDPLAFALVHDAQKSAHQGKNLPTIIKMMDEFEEMICQLNSPLGSGAHSQEV